MVKGKGTRSSGKGRKRRRMKGDGFIGDALTTLGKIGTAAGSVLGAIPGIGKVISLPLTIGGTLQQELGKFVSSKGFGKKKRRHVRRR